MKSKSLHTVEPKASRRMGRIRLLGTLLLIGFGLGTAALLVPRNSKPNTQQPATPPSELVQSAQETTVSATATRRAELAPGQRLQPAREFPPEQASSPALQAVESLSRLEVAGGVLSPEEAAAWKQKLRQLVGQGAVAVPAIREFLLKPENQDLDFTSVPGWQLLGQPSLRTALLNALSEIGGQEAQEALVQTLRTTAVPAEVALIAGSLERQAPGVYRLETFTAVNEILDLGSKGKLAGLDVAPLFQVLQSYGGSEAVQALERARPQWNYYASITLAGLADGEGVAALIRQAQAAAPGDGGQGEFGLQMLAQIAAQNPEASAALIEQARAGAIPESAWARLASGLSGDQYGLIALANDPSNVSKTLGAKVYYVAQGNQRFYSLPFRAIGAMEQIDQRRALIDQLLAANPSPAAVRALQDARTRLGNLLAGK